MRIKYLFVLLAVVVIAISAYFGREYLTIPPKQLVLEAKSPAAARDAEKILKRRFEHYPVSIFSSVESAVEGSRVVITFKHGAPKREIVDFLVAHQGNLIGRGADGIMWFTTDDIVGMSVKWQNGKNFLMLGVSDAAAKRVSMLSKKAIGKTVFVDFDGELLRAAIISAPLSKRFEVDVKKDPGYLLLVEATILGGRLAEPLAIIKNEI